jgi:hypothetical protein
MWCKILRKEKMFDSQYVDFLFIVFSFIDAKLAEKSFIFFKTQKTEDLKKDEKKQKTLSKKKLFW